MLFLLPVFLSGCTTIYNPATGHKERYLITSQQEIRLGANIDKELRKRLIFNKDSAVRNRFNTIIPRIIKACDRQDIVYFFRIVRDDSLNAFSTPGGYVYVNTGLLKVVNDDELACVLGHEIGHITARHSIKRLQAGLGTQMVVELVLGVSNNRLIAKAADIMLNITGLSYSRKDEFQADELGIKYARKAGFDPSVMVSLLEKLKNDSPKLRGVNFEFLQDHPTLDRRIKNVKIILLKSK